LLKLSKGKIGEGNERRSKNRGVGNGGRYAKAFDQRREAGKKKMPLKRKKNVSNTFSFWEKEN